MLDTVRFFDDYDRCGRQASDEVAIGWTKYDGYPIKRVKTEDVLILLEGHLYDVPDVTAELRRIAKLVSRSDVEAIGERLSRRDGDFLLACVRTDTGEVVLVNDTLARLPTYRATIGDTVVISRELKLIRELASRAGKPLELDRIAASQSLIFGHTLGTRTTFDGVRSLPPGTIARLDGSTSIERYFRHDFGHRRHADKSVEENADTLASLFADACRNRNLDGQPNLLSLSGGLDSRVVAGAYADLDIPFTAVSFDNERGIYEGDVRAAEAVAGELDVRWKTYEARAGDTGRAMLLETMQGMNDIRMSFIVDFFEQLDEEYNAGTYVTGDGGDKALVDLTPPRELDGVEGVVDYALSAARRLPLEDAADVVDVDPALVRASIRDRIESYPETNPDQLYVHFLVRERGGNMLTQGEDRNRYYFWSTTPFYSLPFFHYAMNCPPEQLQNRRLYTAVLESFDQELLEIEYPDYGAAITSTEYRIKEFLYGQLSKYPPLRRRVMKLLKGYNGNREVAAEVTDQLATGDLDPLSEQGIEYVLKNPESYRVYALNSMLTVTSFVHDLNASTGCRPTDAVAVTER